MEDLVSLLPLNKNISHIIMLSRRGFGKWHLTKFTRCGSEPDCKLLPSLVRLDKAGKMYNIYLVKDDEFPEGEEAIIGEFATLLCFKHERVN